MKYIGKNSEYFEILTITKENNNILKHSKKSELSLIWFESDANQLIIDSIARTFNTDDIICLTEFHKIELLETKELKLFPFYCILDHDNEVGCKGILYYGASNTPVLHPSEKELDILRTVWKMLMIEMESQDNLQLEMLQMMLKRILISRLP